MKDYKNIQAKYTTTRNPYKKPAIVMFNDKPMSDKDFKFVLAHEHGHELLERTNKNVGGRKEEIMCDRIAHDFTSKNKWDYEAAKKEGRNVKFMKPIDFLNKTSSLEKQDNKEDFLKKTFGKYYDKETSKSEDITKLGDYIKSKDTKVDIPFIYDEDGYDHEGRHRAYAAMQSGEKEIPVIGRQEEKHLDDKAFDKWWNKTGFESSGRYRDEWKGRFKKGTPEERMDRENRKLYIETKEEIDNDELREGVQDFVQKPCNDKGQGRCGEAAQSSVNSALRRGVKEDDIKVFGVQRNHPFKEGHSNHVITKVEDKFIDPTRTQFGENDDIVFSEMPKEYSNIQELNLRSYIKKDETSENIHSSSTLYNSILIPSNNSFLCKKCGGEFETNIELQLHKCGGILK